MQDAPPHRGGAYTNPAPEMAGGSTSKSSSITGGSSSRTGWAASGAGGSYRSWSNAGGARAESSGSGSGGVSQTGPAAGSNSRGGSVGVGASANVGGGFASAGGSALHAGGTVSGAGGIYRSGSDAGGTHAAGGGSGGSGGVSQTVQAAGSSSRGGTGGGAAGANVGGSLASSEAAGSSGTAGGTGYDGNSGWYVDPSLGSDQNPGTRALPFKTIEQAASKAQSGHTVWLFDGDYDATTEPRFADDSASGCWDGSGIKLVAGVTLAALGPGRPRLSSSAHVGLCLNGGVVRDIDFQCMTLERSMTAVTSGREEFEACSFAGCAPALAIGTSTAIVKDLRPIAKSARANDYFADVLRDGELTVDGGHVIANTRAFYVLDGKLTLSDVDVSVSTAVRTRDTAGIVLRGTGSLSAAGTAISGFWYGIDATVHDTLVDVRTTTISNSRFGYYQENYGSTKTTLSHVEFKDSDYGIKFYAYVASDELVVSGGSLHDIAYDAIRCDMGIGTVTLSDLDIYHSGVGCSFSGTGTRGETELSVTMRRVSITDCSDSGIQIRGNFPAHYDFGTLESPGGNTLTGNGQSGSEEAANLYFWLTSPELVWAVGNTWDPNVQDADSSGHFEVADPGTTLDITTGYGQNFRIDSANQARIRLAESAK